MVSGSGAPACYAGSNTLQWYINAVGEDPCMTYQRLRQVCNSNLRRSFKYAVSPGSVVSEEADCLQDTCCCNSIAWSLRMLCINCQWDEFGAGDPGHSARTSGSGLYCGDGYNQTLPDSVQNAVCNKNIRISPFLYSIYWPDGSCTTFELLAQQTLASNQSLDMCASNSSSTTSTTSATGTATSTNTGTSPAQTSSGSKVDRAAVVGGTLGAALGLVLVGVIVAVLYKRKHRFRHNKPTIVDAADDGDYRPSTQMDASAHVVSPFLSQPRGQRSTEQLSQGAASSNAQSESNLISQTSYPLPTPMFDESQVDGYPARERNNFWGQEKAGRSEGSTNDVRPDIELRARDGGVSVQDWQLPPDYRTVYSE
ncbi:uncharacterized protein B0H18DRAFT_1025670 [Fomitopsis serialis]|uniref:uncharacterized protein n=1 Tax=Fomitopsis serialis TaxID=139415 RepID=UPI00200874CD|nr:uncharacterized protein B0H18DRAFT_1025670 [Neoantrodia serialis]KAH9920050.1 hypothetical protein B0H18DRAFT_1025670 [Neoantrodia serialis]